MSMRSERPHVPEHRQRVAMLSRILAWVLLCATLAATVIVIRDVYRDERWTWDFPATLVIVAGFPLMLWASAYVAFTGCSPLAHAS